MPPGIGYPPPNNNRRRRSGLFPFASAGGAARDPRYFSAVRRINGAAQDFSPHIGAPTMAGAGMMGAMQLLGQAYGGAVPIGSEQSPNTIQPSMSGEQLLNRGANPYEVGLRERMQSGQFGRPTPQLSIGELRRRGVPEHELQALMRRRARKGSAITPSVMTPEHEAQSAAAYASGGSFIGQPVMTPEHVAHSNAVYGSGGSFITPLGGYATPHPRTQRAGLRPYSDPMDAMALSNMQRMQSAQPLHPTGGVSWAAATGGLPPEPLPPVNAMTPYAGMHIGLSSRGTPGAVQPASGVVGPPQTLGAEGAPGSLDVVDPNIPFAGASSLTRAQQRAREGGQFVAYRGPYASSYRGEISDADLESNRRAAIERREQTRPLPGFPRLPARMTPEEVEGSRNQRRSARGALMPPQNMEGEGDEIREPVLGEGATRQDHMRGFGRTNPNATAQDYRDQGYTREDIESELSELENRGFLGSLDPRSGIAEKAMKGFWGLREGARFAGRMGVGPYSRDAVLEEKQRQREIHRLRKLLREWDSR